MKEVTCQDCGTVFQMGYNGVTEDGRNLCDSCAGVVRGKSGYEFSNDGKSNYYLPIYSNYSGKVGPGDFVIKNPMRRK